MSQTVHVQTFDYGGSLTSATLRSLNDDTLVATAVSTNEVTADGGMYAIVFDEVSPIATGTYRLRAIVGGQPLQRYVTFAGVDGEIVQAEIQAGLATAAALAVVDGIVDDILAAILGSEVVQVASPNVQGNLVLTQGDDYDGTANPKAQWTVSVDYTDGWSVAFTIRDADDVVVYTTTGEVVSTTVVAVTIVTPTGLTMAGCPGQWQCKFDVELTKAGKKKTIALGTVYINEDQTR